MVISDYSIRRPISISMIVLGILLLGMVSIGGIPVNLLPDITFPRVTIRTEYAQAAPAEVENMVTRPIEQVVGVINRVVSISSISKSGLSDVIVEFEWGADLDVATMEIREKLQILQFPDDVEKPVILRYDPSQDPVMTLGITAEMNPSELRYFTETEIQLPLERLDGVAAVKVQGGYDEEILVAIDEKRMAQLGITITQVINRLESENINLAGGTLRDAGAELSVRTTNAFKSLDDIRELVIVPQGVSPGAATFQTSTDTESGKSSSGLASLMGLASAPDVLSQNIMQESLAATLLTSPPATSKIKLRDFTEVKRIPKKRDEIARLDGKECIQVSIYKEGDANIVAVCRLLRHAIDGLYGSFRKAGAIEPIPEWNEIYTVFKKSPGKGIGVAWKKLHSKKTMANEELIMGLKIVTIVDQAVFIERAIDEVYSGALGGAILAVIVIYLFLRNAMSTLIIVISIPVSVIATFNFMYFMHITWNAISIGGLALGVGNLVDNSIVVLENIFRLREEKGGKSSDIASQGAEEVAMPMLASTLTNVVVFFPLIFVTGVAGQIFRDLAFAVTLCSILSLLTAYTLVPMFYVLIWPDKEPESPAPQTAHPGGKVSFPIRFIAQGIYGLWKLGSKVVTIALKPILGTFGMTFEALKNLYPGVLKKVLDKPRRVVLTSIALSLASLFVLFIVGFELLPSVDKGEFIVQMKMQTGTPIEITDKKVGNVEKAFETIRQTAYIDHLFTSVGYGVGQAAGTQQKSENMAEIQTMLLRTRPIEDVFAMNMMRDKLQNVLVGAEVKINRPTLLSYKAPIEVEIVGNNLDELKRISTNFMALIESVPGIHDVESTGRASNPEIHIVVDRERAASLGLTPVQITDELRKKIKGEVATNLDEGENQIDIVVQVREEDRLNPDRIRDMVIPKMTGGNVPLRVLAKLIPAQGPGMINRVGNSRVEIVTADLTGRPLGDAVRDITRKLSEVRLPTGYFWRITGQNEEMRRSLLSLIGASLLAAVLVYLVLASLFESLVHPFVIMFTVPYSFIGMAAILFLTGTTLNVFSLIGAIMLFGIVVNNAIIYIETVNQRRREGHERLEALVQAGTERMRPILITTITTVLGMVPMAMVRGEGSELIAPIAIVVIGGLTASTICTLLFIPSVYLVLDRMRPGGGLKPPKDPSEHTI